MVPEPVTQALRTLDAALADHPGLAPGLHRHWRHGHADLDAVLTAAADALDEGLIALSSNACPEEIFGESSRDVVFLWCAASADRTDLTMMGLLRAAAAAGHVERARVIARNRVIRGPLRDALACVPMLGPGSAIRQDENFEARARLEILIWEAGARALQLPDLGAWIWADAETFEAVIGAPAHGSLRGRVLAARCIEIAACGIPPHADPQLVGRTLQVLQPLLLHPEPLVWVHAARSFGRLAGVFEPLEGTLLDWVHRASPVLRQRALTAFASLPAARLAFLGHELEAILEDRENEAWVLAAAAAASPYLFDERRDLWKRLSDRILAGEGKEGESSAVAVRALARGLATLWRRGAARRDEMSGPDRETIETTFRQLRTMARRASAENVDDSRRWLETIATTDPIDAAERDPLDIETGLENLVRVAAEYDDAEADARAARFAGTLAPTFAEARRILLSDGTQRSRAAAINAVEGCARSLALRLWGPLLATRPEGEQVSEPNLEELWALVARTPAELLDVVAGRRGSADADASEDLALEIVALKLGGYALDACGAERDLGPRRGQAAHDICLWLRKLQGLVDGSRELPDALRPSLSALFWRLVDTTRGTSLGEVDDIEWLGPFAAWWALVIDRPTVLQQLGTALPMIADGALEACCSLATDLRGVIDRAAHDPAWGDAAMEKLRDLSADDTELARALSDLATSLEGFARVSGMRPDLEASCVQLVMAAERLQSALADPVRALHPAEKAGDDSLSHRQSENAPRMASVLARAIRAREIALLEVWFAALGPTASALVEAAVTGAISRTPPPPPAPPKSQPQMIVGYELIKALGEGGIGSVWLVRKPGADRFFVLKIPKSDVLANATDTEREGILASFHEEAKALAGLYHPNVANIIDRGVDADVPYLVLEYLIGADLKMYSSAKPMSLFELGKVVGETCAGLTSLHAAGLVHRDIKPANLWLRLPLKGGEPFDPEKHRDPARAQPLSTVIIDFGMVRASRVTAEVGGRFVAGTPGYIAPEQVLDPVELDGRADVYALAGTIYNCISGRTFFDEIEQPRERIIAHMRQDPMEDPSRFAGYPAALVKLLRAATAREWKDRPTPLEFGREFTTLL